MRSTHFFLFITIIALSLNGYAKDKSKKLMEHRESLIRVDGVVVDSKTGETLAGVKVKLTGSEVEVYTNLEGEFEFTNLTPGEYSIECNMVTYEQFNLSDLKFGANGGKNSLVLRLNPVSIKFRSKHKYEPITCG